MLYLVKLLLVETSQNTKSKTQELIPFFTRLIENRLLMVFIFKNMNRYIIN